MASRLNLPGVRVRRKQYSIQCASQIIMNILENLTCRFLEWRFTKGYGADCPEVDENVLADGGCVSCKARIAIGFLREHREPL